MNVTTAPINFVFLKYTVLSVLGMVAISSAGIVDGYFVGNYVGPKGLATINITLPIFSLFFGISLAFGIGGSVMSGKLLAMNKKAEASAIFTKTILAISLISIALSFTLFIYMEPVLKKMGANPSLLPHVIKYLKIMILFFPSLMVGVALDYFARVDGRPSLAFIGLTLSATINIILDWYLVSKMGWGLRGAAFGTGISFLTLIIVILPHFLMKKGDLYFTTLWKNSQNILKVAVNGASEFINESSLGITTLLFNLAMLKHFGSDGVSAFAIITYWLWIGQMGMFGICDALSPLISKNHGAKQHLRVKKLLKLGIGSVFSIGLFMILLLVMVPEHLAKFFLKDDVRGILNIVLDFGKWIWPVFLFNGLNLVISAYFTALQLPKQSASIALLRGSIFPGFFIYILPSFFGSFGVFLALPVAEILTAVVAILLIHNSKIKI